MFIKICGTTNLVDAELAIELGADALGFIFAPSKRHMTAEQVGEITRHLPGSIERVGVFTDSDANTIETTVQKAGLTAVQMHWTYAPDRIMALRERLGPGIRLWQVVGFEVDPVDEEAAMRRFTGLLRAAVLDARLAVVLLDTVKGGASGGLGQPFSWWRAGSILKSARLAAQHAAQTRGLSLPLIALAGGLDANNLREAVAAIRPWAVDVVSGVEARPGVKSPDRLRAFIAAAQAAAEVFPPLP